MLKLDGKIVNLMSQPVRIALGIGVMIAHSYRNVPEDAELQVSVGSMQWLHGLDVSTDSRRQAVFEPQTSLNLPDDGAGSMWRRDHSGELRGALNEAFDVRYARRVDWVEFDALAAQTENVVTEGILMSEIRRLEGGITQRTADYTYAIVPRWLAVLAWKKRWKCYSQLIYPCDFVADWKCFTAFALAEDLFLGNN